MSTSKHQYSVRCFLAFKEISINNLRVTPATAEFVAPIEVQNTQYDKMPVQLWYSRNGETEALLFDGVVTQVAPVKEKNKTLYSQVRCEAGVYNALKNTYLHTFTPEKADPIREKINYNLKTQVSTPSGGFNDTNLKAWLLKDAINSPTEILTSLVDLISHKKDAEDIGNIPETATLDYSNKIKISLLLTNDQKKKLPSSVAAVNDSPYLFYVSNNVDRVYADIYLSLPDILLSAGIDIDAEVKTLTDKLYYSLRVNRPVSESKPPEEVFATETSADTRVGLSGNNKPVDVRIALLGDYEVRDADFASIKAKVAAIPILSTESEFVITFLQNYNIFRTSSGVEEKKLYNAIFGDKGDDYRKTFFSEYIVYCLAYYLNKQSKTSDLLSVPYSYFNGAPLLFSEIDFTTYVADTKTIISSVFTSAGITSSSNFLNLYSLVFNNVHVDKKNKFEDIPLLFMRAYPDPVDDFYDRNLVPVSFFMYKTVYDFVAKAGITTASDVMTRSSFSKVNTAVTSLDYWRHKVFSKIQDGYKIRGVNENTIYRYFCNMKKTVGQDVVLNHVSRLLSQADSSLLALINAFITAYQHRIILTFPKNVPGIGYCELFIDRDFVANAYPDKRYSRYIPAAFTQDFGKKVFVSNFNYIFRVNDENLYRLQRATTPLVYDIQKNALIGVDKIDGIFETEDRYYTSPNVIDISVDPTLRDIVSEVQTKRSEKADEKLSASLTSRAVNESELVQTEFTKRIVALYKRTVFSDYAATVESQSPAYSWLSVFKTFTDADNKTLADSVALCMWELGGSSADGFKTNYNTKCSSDYLVGKTNRTYNLFPITLPGMTFQSFSQCLIKLLQENSSEVGSNYSFKSGAIKTTADKDAFYAVIAKPLYDALITRGFTKLQYGEALFYFLLQVLMAQLAGESAWGKSEHAKIRNNFGGINKGKTNFPSVSSFCLAYVDFLNYGRAIKVSETASFDSGLKSNVIQEIISAYKKQGAGCVDSITGILTQSGYIQASVDITGQMYGDYRGLVNSVDYKRACAAFDKTIPDVKIIVPVIETGKLTNNVKKLTIYKEYTDLQKMLPGGSTASVEAEFVAVKGQEILPFGDTISSVLYTPESFSSSVQGKIPSVLMESYIIIKETGGVTFSWGKDIATDYRDKLVLRLSEDRTRLVLLVPENLSDRKYIFYDSSEKEYIAKLVKILPNLIEWKGVKLPKEFAKLVPSSTYTVGAEAQYTESSSEETDGYSQTENKPSAGVVETLKLSATTFLPTLLNNLSRVRNYWGNINPDFDAFTKDAYDSVSSIMDASNAFKAEVAAAANLSKDFLSTVSGSVRAGVEEIKITESVRDNIFGYLYSVGQIDNSIGEFESSKDGKLTNLTSDVSAILAAYRANKENGMWAVHSSATQALGYDGYANDVFKQGVLPLLDAVSSYVLTGLYYYIEDRGMSKDIGTVYSTLSSCEYSDRVKQYYLTAKNNPNSGGRIRGLDVSYNDNDNSLHKFGLALDVTFSDIINLQKLGSFLPGKTLFGLDSYNDRAEFVKYLNDNKQKLLAVALEKTACPACVDLLLNGYVFVWVYNAHFHYDIGNNNEVRVGGITSRASKYQSA